MALGSDGWPQEAEVGAARVAAGACGTGRGGGRLRAALADRAGDLRTSCGHTVPLSTGEKQGN